MDATQVKLVHYPTGPARPQTATRKQRIEKEADVETAAFRKKFQEPSSRYDPKNPWSILDD